MHLIHSNAHDLVFSLVLWMFSILSSNCSTKTLKNPILLYCVYWDCVGLFSCSLGTISGTNIFGAISRDEVENLFSIIYLSFHWFWEVNLNQQILKTTFHQYFTVLLRELEQEVYLVHLYSWVFHTRNRYWKQLGISEGLSHHQPYVTLINHIFHHLFLFWREKNKIHLGWSL